MAPSFGDIFKNKWVHPGYPLLVIREHVLTLAQLLQERNAPT
jgi:3-isopropylmalate dehydratase small subunit